MKTNYGKNERLQHLIDEIKYADTKIHEMEQYRKEQISLIMEEFSTVDPVSDFEGTENIETDTDAVTLTWKITRTFDEQNLKFICNAHDMDIEKVANVKYNYSATLMKKLPADLKSELELNAITQKRASTGFKLTNFANKEN